MPIEAATPRSSKELPLDVAVTQTDVALAVVTHAGKVLAARGDMAPAWLASARHGESTNYVDADHALRATGAVRCAVRPASVARWQ
ncbi:hypothetical protein C0063_15620 [Pseudoxanthomonas sp. KAs_5_3]|nr:hypothetical protein C0063_15620 [Pseudoxanthomonas sp. KAs_5_3]